jgi:hypothetical protein
MNASLGVLDGLYPNNTNPLMPYEGLGNPYSLFCVLCFVPAASTSLDLACLSMTGPLSISHCLSLPCSWMSDVNDVSSALHGTVQIQRLQLENRLLFDVQKSPFSRLTWRSMSSLTCWSLGTQLGRLGWGTSRPSMLDTPNLEQEWVGHPQTRCPQNGVVSYRPVRCLFPSHLPP